LSIAKYIYHISSFNFSIEPGIGYWVYVKENATIEWQGELANVDIQLYTGYNLIGWTSVEKGNASVALHKIREATVAITWNESMHEYKTYIKRWSHHRGNFDLPMGKGFYLYCTEASRWNGN